MTPEFRQYDRLLDLLVEAVLADITTPRNDDAAGPAKDPAAPGVHHEHGQFTRETADRK